MAFTTNGQNFGKFMINGEKFFKPLTFLQLPVNIFQYKRSTAKFLTVLRLTVNPMETLLKPEPHINKALLQSYLVQHA